MSSFKQLMKDGILKRADSYKAHITDIVIQEGFNAREMGERLAEHINSLANFIRDGGSVPPLEVRPLENGKVEVVDGHCRLAALSHLRNTGADIEYVSVVSFQGDDADRTARIVTSNEGLKLTPLEVARVYQRLRDEHGMGPEAISRKVNKTRQHVDQMLILAEAPQEVQQMVADGTVSATEAMKVTRLHGDKAGEVLGQAAQAAGGKKVTAKTLKPWTPPAKVVQPLVATLEEFMGSLTAKEHEVLADFALGATDAKKVEVDAAALVKLIQAHNGLAELREEAEAKAREKANQAAQTEMEGV